MPKPAAAPAYAADMNAPAATSADLARVAKALGHPARIHILRLLLEKPACIGCDIVEEVGLAQSTVAEHLRILRAAGIITGEIDRPRICYSLNPETLRPLTALLDAVLAQEARGQASGSICCPPAPASP